MDTDSMYFALCVEEAVKPELREQFEREKKQWLSWDKWSSREPGLFKLESEGTRAIALCSKCYFVEDEQSGKAKMSSKGMSKAQNKLLWTNTRGCWKGIRTWPQTEVEVAKSLTKEQLAYLLFKENSHEDIGGN